mgnify:CR=1 FL=1
MYNNLFYLGEFHLHDYSLLQTIPLLALVCGRVQAK